MSHVSEFIESIRQKNKLQQLRGILNGFTAAEQDMTELQKETDALRKETAELRALLASQKEAVQKQEQTLLAQIAILQEAISPEGAIRQNLERLNVNVRNNNTHLENVQKVLTRKQTAAQHQAVPSSSGEVVSSGSAYEAIDYFDFENHFRGSMEHIKETQRVYLPYFTGKQHVLDLGCGRGEFLSLMQEEGIPAVGVDLYEPYADHCTLQGLDVHCGDGIAFLRQMKAVDGIFAGQVIEHLQTEQITELCTLAFEKLPEGGCIVMETPNPTSLAIYTNAFYIDPSHVKPVHPLTMQYLLGKAGFSQIELLYPETSRPPQQIPTLAGASEEFNEAMQTVSQILFGSQDYAVIAVK